MSEYSKPTKKVNARKPMNKPNRKPNLHFVTSFWICLNLRVFRNKFIENSIFSFTYLNFKVAILPNSMWLYFTMLIIGATLFYIGNETLIDLAIQNQTNPHENRYWWNQNPTTLEAHFWWGIQLSGLALSLISLLEIYTRLRKPLRKV